MKTSFKYALAAAFACGLFGSLLNAGQWSLNYHSSSDGPHVSATVSVPSAATVAVSSYVYVNWYTGYYPWASLQLSVEGPNYAKVQIRNEPYSSPYDYEYGTPTAGEYYVDVSTSTSEGSYVDAWIEIDW